jgi:hypothetical protein
LRKIKRKNVFRNPRNTNKKACFPLSHVLCLFLSGQSASKKRNAKMSRQVAKVEKSPRAILSYKAKRALARRERAEAILEDAAAQSRKGELVVAADSPQSAEFRATGSQEGSNRGLVSRYLLGREPGEHSVRDIARALDGKLRRSERAPDKDAVSLVTGCLSHIYRRARYNAQGVGFVIRKGDKGPIVEVYAAPASKARKPALPSPATVPALPSPESKAS